MTKTKTFSTSIQKGLKEEKKGEFYTTDEVEHSVANAVKSNLASYSTLLERVRQAIARGKERALDAVERELVRTKWEVGKLILEHLLLNRKRAKYGEEVLKRLARDLGTSITELKYMVEYARLNPKSPHAGFLSWDKQRDLLAINEREKRAALAREADRNKWSRETLRREIKKLKTAKQITLTKSPAGELMLPKKGKLGTYKIVIAKLGPSQDKPVVDLGFSNYLSLDVISRRWPQPGAAAFKEGDIVISKPSKNGFTLHPSPFTLHA